MLTTSSIISLSCLLFIIVTNSIVFADPLITAWIKCTGRGYNNITANVQEIQYSSAYVYINASSVPSYTVGPWGKNFPNVPTNQKAFVRFTRNPTASSTKTATSLGHIGLLTNGVGFYNAKDAKSYNSLGVWYQNAFFWEVKTFDTCNGHSGPNGEYHHHVNPVCLYNSTDSSKHSPIIGFALDGYPIYGVFGYSSAMSASSGIKRMKSSYRLRNITNRTRLTTGSLTSAKYGPPINSTYPLGAYLEDYEYVSGLGDLDDHNGRFGVTPDYPNGTYAYFATTDSSNVPTYPYLIGPTFNGVTTTQVTKIPTTEAASVYFLSTIL